MTDAGQPIEVSRDKPTRVIVRRTKQPAVTGPRTETLVLDDPLLGLLAGVACDLTHEDGAKEQLTADAQGKVAFVTQGAFVDLVVHTPLGDRARRVMITRDDPATPKGAWQRLVNLGYAGAAPSPQAGPEELAAAIEEFQSEVGLRPTGDLCDRTIARLQKEAHAEAPWQSWACPVQPSPDGPPNDLKSKRS
jgi:hypothetical protein